MTKPEDILSFHYEGMDLMFGPNNQAMILFVRTHEDSSKWLYWVFGGERFYLEVDRDDKSGPVAVKRLGNFEFYGVALKTAYQFVGWDDYDPHKEEINFHDRHN